MTTVKVERVIDGDTFVIEGGQRVRLLQVNAPEKGQCGYRDATRALRELVEGETVQLESEPRFGNTDKYNRLLRYVHVKDTNVNVKLQQKGFVDTMFYEGDHGKYAYLMNGTGTCAY